MNDKNEQDKSGTHAEGGSIAINGINVGGNIGGNFHVGNTIHQHEREATPSEIRRQAELADLDLLQRRISSKLENLKKQLEIPFDRGRNPYRFGQALSLREGELLAGRENVISNVLGLLQINHSVFLTGNGGCGRTSLLQAGLMPPIVKQSDLPVLISMTTDPLELSIKRQFLPEVAQTPYLSQVPLATFLRHVTECLPPTQHVYLLVDELEDFLARDPSEMASFKQGWLQALIDSPRVHWLFSIHQGFFQLLNFFRPEINPFSELVTLSLLDREAARQAILRPASLIGIYVDEAVSTDIVDRLGDANITPAQLQTVCYLMAGGNGSLRRHWTMAEYESEGRADGILRQSLERLVSQFPRGDREFAWQVMAVLVEHKSESVSFESLLDRLQPDGVGSETLRRLLRLLAEIHLIDVRDEQYYLSSESLRPRIQQWVHEQSALTQARHEAMNQLRQLRNSALRGLLGGAIGFVLFNWFIYKGPSLDLSYRIFILTQLMSIGGIAGFLLTLTVDLSVAAYHGSRTWLRYLAGMIGGMVAMGSGFLLYLNNNYALGRLLSLLPAASLEGALWGAVIGVGTTFAFSVTRRAWLGVLGTALAGGLVLLGTELGVGSVLANDLWKERPSSLAIFLAGALVPFFYMAAALVFRRSAPEKGG
jgi:hypothetical protein